MKKIQKKASAHEKSTRTDNKITTPIKKPPSSLSPSSSEIVLYTTPDGKQRIDVRLENATVWLSQKMIADLFQVLVPTINEHIKNIFDEGELLPQATIRKFLIVQTEGSRQVSRQVDFYNLEMILAIGYRARSHRGIAEGKSRRPPPKIKKMTNE